MLRRNADWLLGTLAAFGTLALGLIAFPDLLSAGGTPAGTVGGPGPLIGVGLPIAGVVLATVFIARRFRRRD